jgi:hypothetical protein
MNKASLSLAQQLTDVKAELDAAWQIINLFLQNDPQVIDKSPEQIVEEIKRRKKDRLEVYLLAVGDKNPQIATALDRGKILDQPDTSYEAPE